jgi:uncharacterized delta-60 repeat protein
MQQYYYCRLFCLFLFSLLLLPAAHGQHFSPDPTFQTPQFKSQQVDVRAVLALPGGKSLAGGAFDYSNGTLITYLAKLEADGTLDNTFRAALTNPVNCLALQPDGKILAGTETTGIVRLNPDGTPDQTFDPGLLAKYYIKSIALQPDGKILVGGDVINVNGSVRPGLIRLNADGSPDATFTAPALLNLMPHVMVVLGDGKLLVGGMSYKSSPNTYLFRLNSDGSVDNSFNAGTGPNGPVNALRVGPNGKILLGGFFSHVNGTARVGVARLNADGTVDPSLEVGPFRSTTYFQDVNALALQADGKVVIGGKFRTPAILAGGQVLAPKSEGIVRVDANGSMDPTFVAPMQPYGAVNVLHAFPDGKLLMAGNYRGGIARVSATGSRDDTFTAAFEKTGVIHTIIAGPGGKTFVSGDFHSAGGKPAYNVARLLPDGQLDESFKAPDSIGTVSSMALQADGKLAVAAPQESAAPKLIRLLADGAPDNAFNPAGLDARAYYRVLLQPDGRMLTIRLGGGSVDSPGVFRLNPDGSADNSFARSKIYAPRVLALQPDGKVLIGGYFTSFNGAPVKHITRLNADGTTDAGFRTGITQSSAIYDFGLLPDGKIIVAHRGTRYNDALQPALFRLRPDGSLDDTYNSNVWNVMDTIFNNVGLQPDGKLMVNGYFRTGPNIARVTAGGAIDSTFTTSGLENRPVNAFVMPAEHSLLVAVPGGLLRLAAPQSQAITFPAVSDKLANDPPFALGATASSGLPVTYAVVSGPATVGGHTVTLTGTPGTVTIRASQAGNGAYAAAPDAEVTFRVAAVLGVEDKAAAVTVYPNPAPGSFRVDTPLRVGAADVGLYDARGQAVAMSLLPVPGGYSLVVQHARPGLYVLRIRTGKNEIARKVFLQ